MPASYDVVNSVLYQPHGEESALGGTIGDAQPGVGRAKPYVQLKAHENKRPRAVGEARTARGLDKKRGV
jgi:hypothetical protein